MILELENRDPVEDPTAEDIANEFAAFDGRRTTFAVLSIDDRRYLQTAGAPEEGFQLEYRDGGPGEHYVNSGGPVSLARVVEAFLQYARGETTWWRDSEWEPVDAHEPSLVGEPETAGCLGVIVTAILLALALALAVCLA